MAGVDEVDELDRAVDALFAGHVDDFAWADWGRPIEKFACYESLDELDFLSHLPFAEQNTRLLAAGVRLLRAADLGAAPPKPECVRVVAIFDWTVLDDNGAYVCNHGAEDLITPYLWHGDFTARGMEHFRFLPPLSQAAEFVRPTADAEDLFVRQSEAVQADGCPQWVYLGTPASFDLAANHGVR